MATGTIKWFNPNKGYGFIFPDEGGNDVFVHISAVEKAGLHQLNEGQKVSYDIGTNNGKFFAENLALIDSKQAEESEQVAGEETEDSGE